MKLMLSLLSLMMFYQGEVSAETAQPVKVGVKSLRDIIVFPKRLAPGQVVSQNISKLSAEVNARIVSIPVEVGQRISQGTLVAKFDCRDFDLSVESAKAKLAVSAAKLQLAQQQLKRTQELALKKFIPTDILDNRKSEYSVGQAEHATNEIEFKTALHQQGKCTIKAPFPAIVESRIANVGELATVGSPILTLWDLSHLEISATVQGNDTSSLLNADTIHFETPEQSYQLTLIRISPAMNATSRTFEARLKPMAELPPPGMSGRVIWSEQVAHLPIDFMVRRKNQLGIFTLVDNVAHFIGLPNAQEGRPVRLIDTDLASLVVIKGQHNLQDGQSVSVQ